MTKPSAVPQALYRDEALAARRSDTNVVLRFASPSFRLIAWFLTAMAIITLVFLFTFDYAKRIRVSGRVVYDEGIAHVYPLTDGVVAKKLVEEGSRVNAGDPLFRITADRQSTLEGSTASGVLLQLRQRSRLFSDQLNRLADLQRKDRISLLRKVEFLRSEVAQISKQLQSQSASVEINDRYLERFQKLVPEKYVPLVVFQEKALANQDAHTRMYALQRDLTESERQLNDAVTELESFDSRAANERSALSREISTLRQEIVEAEMRREEIVYSKIAGTITAALVEVGQKVAVSQILASVVPANSHMYVQLNVPTGAAGQIEKGQSVLLRYAAFPYEKFGQFNGRVAVIPKAALSSGDLKLVDEAKDFFYPVRVDIELQHVEVEGHDFPLREGMSVDADILLDKRKIIEWLIQPAMMMKRRYSAGN